MHDSLLATIPKLTRQARLITRNPADAEDLVQDTLLSALINKHDPSKGLLGAWLYRIMRNVWLAQRRRDKFHGPMPDYWDEPVEGAQEVALEAGRAVGAVGALPERQREALMAAAMGEEYAEIAEAMRVPIGTIKSRVSHGRRAVREAVYGN